MNEIEQGTTVQKLRKKKQEIREGTQKTNKNK